VLENWSPKVALGVQVTAVSGHMSEVVMLWCSRRLWK